MRSYTLCSTLLAASLAAGCASAPERPTENRAGLQESAAETPPAAEAAPSEIIDLSAQPDLSANRVTCREMLKQGSNVIITRCLSQADWEAFERHQAQEAQAILRMLQGSGYR